MKRNLLFMIFCITTLTFAGCGKTETPVMSNNVKTESSTEVETTIENEEITEEVEAPTETIIEETVENNQETTTSTVDSTGSDVQIDEGDYVEPSLEELEAATTETTSDSGYSADTKIALNNAKSMYDQGYITEEEYNETVEIILRVEESKNNPSSSSNSGGYGQIQLTPEQQAAADAMDTTGQGDQRTNLDYDNVEVPEHLKGDWFN